MNTHIFDGTAVSASGPLNRVYAVIPAGGVGTRLWRLSRANAPKSFHNLTGTDSTLIPAAYDGLAPLIGKTILLVTGMVYAARYQMLPTRTWSQGYRTVAGINAARAAGYWWQHRKTK